MALHNIIIIANNEYLNKPIQILIDCLNGLYIIKTKIKHATLHDNHPNKTLLEEIVVLLQQQTQPISLYKVHAHAHIEGNKQAKKRQRQRTP